jgi:PrpF protein
VRLFAQVVMDKALVDTSLNCGNILSAVGPFAIEHPSLQFFPSVSGSPFPLRAFQRQFLESPPLGQGAVC